MRSVLRPRHREALRQATRTLRVERLYDWALRQGRALSAAQRDRRWQGIVGSILENGVTIEGGAAWASAGDDAVPVVVCLWNRPDRAEDVVRMLSEQRTSVRVRLLLWNNNPRDAGRYARLATHDGSGALASVDVHDSARNIGGLARFVAARLARNGGYAGPMVMLDDDQDVSPTFIEDLLRDYLPRSVVAWWAFSQHGSYWRRAEIEPGDEADHAGTGGTVYDSALVADDRFFACLPSRFAFLEDQWMSFVAHRRGWRVVKARTDIGLVSEELNQYHALKPLKDVFFAEQHSGAERLWGPPVQRPRWNRGRLS